jgi:hypothetical protein
MTRVVPMLLGAVVVAAVVAALSGWLSMPSVSAGADGPMICEDDAVSTTSQLYGARAGDVAVLSMDRTPVMFHDLAGERFTVVVFCSYNCPCSDGYAARLGELRRDFEAQGVRFLALHSNANENIEGMRAYIERTRYPLPVYRDEFGAAADALGAGVTPEIFLFDTEWTLRYHGRIDDEKSGLYVSHQSLRLALDTLLSGRSLVVTEQPSPGCAIVRHDSAEL